MSNIMEWMIIFFMLYTFFAVWFIVDVLEKIIIILSQINDKE
jgi:hypothetical protein